MASINKLASGKWHVQVRIKGHYLSDSFLLRKNAEMCARRMEREIDLGEKPAPKHKDGIKTFSDLIDLHIADMKEVGKEIGRSKGFSLDLLRARLGKLKPIKSSLTCFRPFAIGQLARLKRALWPVVLS